ncbi:hypothetical protein KCG44_01040 [Pacificimonas sp. WHA3]|uniref:Inner membrane protein n=1 Tax=Pacificimonas pallii TaxID=2827236 RepID=A0ABS6SBS5_9SPHN|nr:hypothetical protein [Pacificimonas pallii]MBV7255361.1 hypothetical protein [Pacificimonas pallii]
MDKYETDPATSGNEAAKTQRSFLPWLIVVALLFLLLGMIANPWFEREVRTRLPWVEQEADMGSVSARLTQQDSNMEQLETRIAALEQRPVAAPQALAPLPLPSGTASAADTPPALNDPVLPNIAANLATDRLARVESRVESIDREQTALGGRVNNLSAEVAGLTVRVEDSRGEAAGQMAAAERLAGDARAVLLLGRARAAFESSEPLGAIGPALQAALPAEAGDDIDQLATGMRQLVSPQQLRNRFADLKPALLGAGQEEVTGGPWDRFVSMLADIFTVRRSGAETDEDNMEATVERISSALGQGNIAAAVDAYARLPASARRQGNRWFADASNHVRTETVLGRLEARVVETQPAAAPSGPAADEATSL